MPSRTAELERLASRASCGDRNAALEFRQKLEPQVEILVGHTLRTGVARSPVARFVLSRCRQVPLPTEGRPEEKRVRYIRTLAGDVCDRILDRLCSAGPQHTMLLEDTLALCG